MTKTLTPHRILHTMLRVEDLEKSLHFYCTHLGMKESRREHFPEGGFTLSFLGYGDEETDTVLELTENSGINRYEAGSKFGHIALAVKDIFAVCEKLQIEGISVARAPGPMKFPSTSGQRDLIAFIEDPDGNQIELIERN